MTASTPAPQTAAVLPLWAPAPPSVAHELGISRDLAYRLGRDGTIPVIRLGRRVVVSRIALDRFLSSGGGE